jgi:hypothetical protein
MFRHAQPPAEVPYAGSSDTAGKGTETFEVTIAILDSTGSQIDSCSTGPITNSVKVLKHK